ncbi:MAG: DUF5132 domain-containing protein [Pseudonocardiaceae bacterium]
MPPFLPVYLIGVATAPLARMVLKPLLRSSVKASVGLVLQVKKLAAEAGEEFQDIAAEASFEMAAAETRMKSNANGSKKG